MYIEVGLFFVVAPSGYVAFGFKRRITVVLFLASTIRINVYEMLVHRLVFIRTERAINPVDV